MARKIELLDAQIEEANDGHPANFSEWRQRTEVVLRTVLGQGTPTYKAFQSVSYSPQVWYSGMDSSGYQPAGVKKVIAILNSAKTEVELNEEVASASNARAKGEQVMPGNRIFIVHGHDDGAKEGVARFLGKLTGQEPIILHEQSNGGKTLIEKFERSAAASHYAVVLLTDDDLGRAKRDDQERPRGRQNVVFEMGFFFGSLGRERVAVLYDEGIDPPGDVNGIVYILRDAAGGWKTELARELEEADIEVDWAALSNKADKK